jgi:hypothetical protein
MSEFGNPISYKSQERRFNLEEERKIQNFIEEIAIKAATILAEKHPPKEGRSSITFVRQKQKLGEEFTKLLTKNNHELATTLFGPSNQEGAAKKLADIGEKLWIK